MTTPMTDERICAIRDMYRGFPPTEELIAEAWLRSARYGCPAGRLYWNAMRAMKNYIARQYQIKSREYSVQLRATKLCKEFL